MPVQVSGAARQNASTPGRCRGSRLVLRMKSSSLSDSAPPSAAERLGVAVDELPHPEPGGSAASTFFSALSSVPVWNRTTASPRPRW